MSKILRCVLITTSYTNDKIQRSNTFIQTPTCFDALMHNLRGTSKHVGLVKRFVTIGFYHLCASWLSIHIMVYKHVHGWTMLNSKILFNQFTIKFCALL
jgi:hypothetical protein